LRRILWLLLLIVCAEPGAAAPVQRIDIIIPTDNANLRDFSQKIQTALQTLQQQQPNLTISVRTRAEAETTNNADVLAIGIGDALLPWLVSPQNKYGASIAFYAGSVPFNANVRANTNIAALYRDQPLPRQLQLAKLLFPKLRRVAILQSEQKLPIDAARLQRLSNLQITIATIRPQQDLAKSLSQLMIDNDILLGVDDPQMYNNDTIHSILLTTYRHGKVLIGPSKPFVAAGSLASCYSGTDQYLQQLAEMVKSYLLTDKLPPSQYPKNYRIVVNEQLATSLGLNIADEQILFTRMQNTAGECGDDC
jgi:ABC-type uncharacterized transport system substrate-binding protein